MYQEKMACAIKVAGKILREHGENVYLPFGSEYSLFIKNLNTRRVCVKIEIDGQDAVEGGVIIGGNNYIDLERFVKEGQLDKGNRFKFIERNERVEQTRGIGLEDGIIRLEFEYEKEYAKYSPHVLLGGGGQPSTLFGSTLYRDTSQYIGTYNGSRASSGMQGSMNVSASSGQLMNTSGVNDAGITVPGSVSEQKFTTTSFYGDGQKFVMVMKLLGEIGQKVVEAPVTVKTKPKCITCGHQNKATAKFCSECGTSLTIV
jgi:hypothetical protein